MRMMLVATVVAMAGAATAAPMQEGSEGATDFARAIYASYSEDGPWPTDEARLDQVFTPRMAALIRRDRALADGDLPYLDADPICSCQDVENLRVLDARVSRDAKRMILVSVRFENGGQEATTVLRLAGNPIRGWKVDDSPPPPGWPSLANALTESNRRTPAGGRALGRD